MKKSYQKPELLAPAGNMEKGKMALLYGADAIYLGGKMFGLRAFANNFDLPEIAEITEYAHSLGKKVYVTVNIFAHNEDIHKLPDYLLGLAEAKVDALLISDLGVWQTARQVVPHMALHVSTQANTTNYAGVQAWEQLGAERVVLARELSLKEIAEISAKTQVELETFVHGAACMAYSGRCLLSAALTGRSGNQGECAQPCRWQYAVMEQKRPGEYLPVCEDAHGTYLFSAKDLNLMPLLPRLCRAGVSSLKIEGRMKTEYYVAVVTGAYRRALDLLAQGEEAFQAALPGLLDELRCASHRDSDTGFALGSPEQPGGAEGFHQEREYIARVTEDAPAGTGAHLELKNRFFAGDTLEVMTPHGVLTAEAQPFLREKTGETLTTLGIAGETIRMTLPFAVQEGDLVRGRVRNHRQ